MSFFKLTLNLFTFLAFSSAEDIGHEIFLERIQTSNPKFGCSWIILQNQFDTESSPINWSFLDKVQPPSIILNDAFNKTLEAYSERRHFSPFCNLVVVFLVNGDVGSFETFIKSPKWTELREFKTSIMSNHFLFLNTNQGSNSAFKFSESLLSLRKFPYWFPLKATVQLDSGKNQFTVTTLC